MAEPSLRLDLGVSVSCMWRRWEGPERMRLRVCTVGRRWVGRWVRGKGEVSRGAGLAADHACAELGCPLVFLDSSVQTAPSPEL